MRAPAKNLNRLSIGARFAVMSGSYYFSTIIFWGFLSSMLKELGCSETFIGTVFAISSVSAVCFKLLFGRLLDRYGRAKLLILGPFTLYFVMQMMMFLLGNNKLFLILFAAVAMGTYQTVGGLCDAWVVKSQQTFHELEYGHVRAVGSISYAVAGLIAGWIITLIGNMPATLIIVGGGLVINLITVLSLPEAEPAPLVEASGSAKPKGVIRGLCGNRRFITLFVFAFLVFTTDLPLANFYPLIMESVGASAFESGLGLFVMAGSEFFVVYWFSSFERHFHLGKLLAFSALVYALRSCLLAISPTPFLSIILMGLQAFAYGLLLPAAVSCINHIVPYRFKATALQIYNTVSSFSRVVFSSLCGAISQFFGVPAMLLAVAVPSLIASAAMFWLVRTGRFEITDETEPQKIEA